METFTFEITKDDILVNTYLDEYNVVKAVPYINEDRLDDKVHNRLLPLINALYLNNFSDIYWADFSIVVKCKILNDKVELQGAKVLINILGKKFIFIDINNFIFSHMWNTTDIVITDKNINEIDLQVIDAYEYNLKKASFRFYTSITGVIEVVKRGLKENEFLKNESYINPVFNIQEYITNETYNLYDYILDETEFKILNNLTKLGI
jgi:hypothetical protein